MNADNDLLLTDARRTLRDTMSASWTGDDTYRLRADAAAAVLHAYALNAGLLAIAAAIRAHDETAKGG